MNGYNRTMKRLAALALALLLMLPCAAPALADAFAAVVTADSMAVYQEASMSTRVGSLPKNTVVQITGFSTTIAKISYNGNSGYAKVSDMKRLDETAKKAVLNAAAPVYKEAQETSQSVLVKSGTQLNLLARSGEWAMVEKNGYIGYVKGEFVTETDESGATPATVSTDAAATTSPTAALAATSPPGETPVTSACVSTSWTRAAQPSPRRARPSASGHHDHHTHASPTPSSRPTTTPTLTPSAAGTRRRRPRARTARRAAGSRRHGPGRRRAS